MKLVKEHLIIDISKMTIEQLIKISPLEIQEIFEKSKIIPQTLIYHPEKWIYDHIKIVFNRAKRTNDINLILAAYFHDMGKIFTTIKHATIPNKWSAHGHEKISSRLVLKYKDWIESLGGDYNIIYYIVDQHMRAKQLSNMRQAKQQIFRSHPHFDLLQQFTEFDNMLKDYSDDLD